LSSFDQIPDGRILAVKRFLFFPPFITFRSRPRRIFFPATARPLNWSVSRFLGGCLIQWFFFSPWHVELTPDAPCRGSLIGNRRPHVVRSTQCTFAVWNLISLYPLWTTISTGLGPCPNKSRFGPGRCHFCRVTAWLVPLVVLIFPLSCVRDLTPFYVKDRSRLISFLADGVSVTP